MNPYNKNDVSMIIQMKIKQVLQKHNKRKSKFNQEINVIFVDCTNLQVTPKK